MLGEFFDAIFARQHGMCELRFMVDDSISGRVWYNYPNEAAQLLGEIGARADSSNCFYGVLLRSGQGGTAEYCPTMTPVLWADFDVKNIGSRLKAFYAMSAVEVEPNIIIDSGRGFHAYWLLDNDLHVIDAQDIMREIAIRHGGDIVGDPARIMRVPGTFNLKGTEPIPVRTVRFNPYERSRIGDFAGYMPGLYDEKDDTFKAGYIARHTSKIEDPKLEARLQERIDHGKRSETIFGIVCQMIRNGWTYDDVLKAMYEVPAGQKIREMGPTNGMRWLQLTFKRAMTAVNLD